MAEFLDSPSSVYVQKIKEAKQIILKHLSSAYDLYIQRFKNHEYIESSNVQEILNHPVHLINKEGFLSPSALIPFCKFGGNMSNMGIKNKHFSVPVCNSFQAKVLNDQLCYEVDPNKYRKYRNNHDDLKQGLTLYIDTNDDRQTSSEESKPMIYLDTLSKFSVFLIIYDTTKGNAAMDLAYLAHLRLKSYKQCTQK